MNNPVLAASLDSSIGKHLLRKTFLGYLNISAYFGNPFFPYIIFGVNIILGILMFGVGCYLLSRLRKHNNSLAHEMSRAMHALMRAPWLLLFFMVDLGTIYLFVRTPVQYQLFYFAYLLYGLCILLPLFYAQPLVYDGYRSFVSIWKTSWLYVKHTWYIVFRFVMTFAFLGAPFLVAGQILLPKFIESQALNVDFLLLGLLVMQVYLALLHTTGYYMIYNHACEHLK